MRKGYDPRLIFSAKGNLVAIATGSDACAEHERGSNPLRSALCDDTGKFDSVVRDLKAGKEVVYPDFVAMKAITRFPGGLQFIVLNEGSEPEAILGYADFDLSKNTRELEFPLDFSSCRQSGASVADAPRSSVAGAWDERSFAVRVRGAKNVKALSGFYEAIKQGRVAFASTFLSPRKGFDLSGVVLADLRYISDEDRSCIKRAQAKWCSDARLKACDDASKVMGDMRRIAGRGDAYLGHLWSMWADADESGVVYGFNPGYGIKADYLGPYTKEQLLDWAKSRFSYQLSRSPVKV